MVRYIIVHCSATPQGRDVRLEDIDRWHRQKGWRCCGYHYVIELDGTLRQGRAETEKGAHCLGRNHDSLGVCYAGGVTTTGEPADTRTPAQKATLARLVNDLLRRYPEAQLAGHYQFAHKACPSFDVAAWAAETGIAPERICKKPKL